MGGAQFGILDFVHGLQILVHRTSWEGLHLLVIGALPSLWASLALDLSQVVRCYGSLDLLHCTYHTLGQLWNFLGPILDFWVQYIIKWVRDPFTIVQNCDWIHLDRVSGQLVHSQSTLDPFFFLGFFGPFMGSTWDQVMRQYLGPGNEAVPGTRV